MPDTLPRSEPSSWYRALDGHPARLDGLRGIAILIVMLYHFCRYPLAQTPASQAFTTIVAMGWTGVDLFFVLSGFLITSILLRHRESSSYFRSFYARRVLRIFPLYYAVLVLFLWLLPAVIAQPELFWIPGADRETIWYWVFLSNFHAAFTGNYQHHFLEVTWSLAIEEQFYLLWPFLVFATSRRRLIQICWGIIIGSLLLRLSIVWHGVPTFLFVYNFTPCRLDELAAGALVAALAMDEVGIARLTRWSRPALWGGVLTYAAAVIWFRLFPGPFGYTTGLGSGEAIQKLTLIYSATPFMQSVGFTLLCFAYGGLLVRAMVAPPRSTFRRILESGVLRSFGKYSFALYLLHVLGGDIANTVFNPDLHSGSFFVAQFGYWAVAIGCSFVLAFGSWHLLELHFHRLRRFFPYRAPNRGS
jgi:peptidoglycan/LPS O-acetylase OafA/YrhL